MPYEERHVPAELIVRIGEIEVFRMYKYGDVNNPLSFWYTLKEDDDEYQFDVRSLPNWGHEQKENTELHANVIREALYHGYFDDQLSELGLHFPRLSDWPVQLNTEEMNRLQLIRLLTAYDEYIQSANEEDHYQSGWRPVCIAEFYMNEFMRILEAETK